MSARTSHLHRTSQNWGGDQQRLTKGQVNYFFPLFSWSLWFFPLVSGHIDPHMAIRVQFRPHWPDHGHSCPVQLDIQGQREGVIWLQLRNTRRKKPVINFTDKCSTDQVMTAASQLSCQQTMPRNGWRLRFSNNHTEKILAVWIKTRNSRTHTRILNNFLQTSKRQAIRFHSTPHTSDWRNTRNQSLSPVEVGLIKSEQVPSLGIEPRPCIPIISEAFITEQATLINASISVSAIGVVTFQVVS